MCGEVSLVNIWKDHIFYEYLNAEMNLYIVLNQLPVFLKLQFVHVNGCGFRMSLLLLTLNL